MRCHRRSPPLNRWPDNASRFGFGFGNERYCGNRELSGPLGSVQMALIYVNGVGR